MFESLEIWLLHPCEFLQRFYFFCSVCITRIGSTRHVFLLLLWKLKHESMCCSIKKLLQYFEKESCIWANNLNINKYMNQEDCVILWPKANTSRRELVLFVVQINAIIWRFVLLIKFNPKEHRRSSFREQLKKFVQRAEKIRSIAAALISKVLLWQAGL